MNSTMAARIPRTLNQQRGNANGLGADRQKLRITADIDADGINCESPLHEVLDQFRTCHVG